MKAKGQIKIEEGLVLNNPTLEILKSSYNWHNNIVNIECIFKEENANYKHSRTFTFELVEDKEYTSKDIVNFIKSHDALNSFE